jgi:uncharacterized protein YqgV (UPF0045/DUF77 family)/DNA-binding CsgD family transcriptional regulator
MSNVRLEFTVEPFREGGPGPHVLAAVQAVRDRGLVPEDGPFGTSVEGSVDELCALVGAIASAALYGDATGLRISLQRMVNPLDVGADRFPPPRRNALIGVHSVSIGTDLSGMLESAIEEVEAALGGRLGQLSRTEKQQAARLLSDRGIFQLRNAVDEIADAMNVSRATIYNYLAAARRDG